jgi:PleD family two-component response regulator
LLLDSPYFHSQELCFGFAGGEDGMSEIFLDADVGDNLERIKVLLVDDHPLFRAGVRQRLSEHDSEIEVVGEAENALEAEAMTVALLPRYCPDGHCDA